MLDRLLVALLPTLLHSAERVLAFAATYVVHSTILTAMAAVATWRAMPWRLSLAARNIAWRVALVGALVTSGAQSVLSIAPLGGTWTLSRPRSTMRAEVAVVVNQRAGAQAQARMGAMRPRTIVVARLAGGSLATLLLAAGMVLASAVGGLLLVRRRRRLACLLAARVDGRDTIAGLALREVQRRSGFTRLVQLTVADGLATPAALSTREICIPSRMLAEFDPLVQESVLAHELAHIRHGDTLWLEAAAWLQAIVPFQPLTRVARRQLQEIAEFTADDWASAVTRQPVVLARALGAVATWLAPSADREQPVAAMLHQEGSPLVRRVRRLTMAGPAPVSGRPVAVAMGAMAMVVLLALTVLAPRLDAGAAATSSTVVKRLLITTNAAGPQVNQWIGEWRGPAATHVFAVPVAQETRSKRPART